MWFSWAGRTGLGNGEAETRKWFRSRMWPRICPTIFLPEAAGSLYIWEVAETHLLNGKGLREEQE